MKEAKNPTAPEVVWPVARALEFPWQFTLGDYLLMMTGEHVHQKPGDPLRHPQANQFTYEHMISVVNALKQGDFVGIQVVWDHDTVLAAFENRLEQVGRYVHLRQE